MTDLRKAAEMALEALEGALSDDQPYIEKSKKAAEALRQALAQPVDAVNMSRECVDETAKREHEPVAWVKLETWVSGETWPDDCFSHFECTDFVPLYTAPPKREWVGLSELELRMIYCNTSEYRDFWQAYSAKLKEKNA